MNPAENPGNAWYTEDGPDSDVILSSRVRLARNLSGFNFPLTLKSDDAERVQSIIFDAFNHLERPEQYQMVRMSDLDNAGKRILSERGVIKSDAGSEPWRAVIIRHDGVLSATVNTEDHLRLTAFTPGRSLSNCLNIVGNVDKQLETKMQFCTLSEFGYLTSGLLNVGSGMKSSVLVCLPGLCIGGLLERVIRDYLAQGFQVRGYYGSELGISLGFLYQISNGSSASGDVFSQITRLDQAVDKIVALERRSRQELLSTEPTSVENTVFRAIVTAKYARYITLKESIDLIHRIKLGLNLGLITGIANQDLTALLFRVQTAHIGFVILGGSVIIEEDVKGEELRMDRLRAMVIQEVLKDSDIHERRQGSV